MVPTALRRLRSGWRPVTADPGASPGDLLPEFITTALFDPLNVPEVWLELPFADDQESLPIEQGAARGRPRPGQPPVRATAADDHRTWLPLPPDGAGGVADIAAFANRYTREGTWQPAGQAPYAGGPAPHDPPGSSPRRRSPTRPRASPCGGHRSSRPPAGLYQADIPDPSPWAGRVTSVGFATHAAGNPVPRCAG